MLIGVLDDVSLDGEEDLEKGGGVVLRIHHVIREVGDKFCERRSTLIHTDRPFQRIYLCVIDLLLLFHFPVLSNQSELSFHRCSEIYPR